MYTTEEVAHLIVFGGTEVGRRILRNHEDVLFSKAEFEEMLGNFRVKSDSFKKHIKFREFVYLCRFVTNFLPHRDEIESILDSYFDSAFVEWKKSSYMLVVEDVRELTRFLREKEKFNGRLTGYEESALRFFYAFTELEDPETVRLLSAEGERIKNYLI